MHGFACLECENHLPGWSATFYCLDLRKLIYSEWRAKKSLTNLHEAQERERERERKQVQKRETERQRDRERLRKQVLPFTFYGFPS